VAPLVLVTAAFVHCITFGWMKWGDWLIDMGRELELPRRMLEGERLYTDLRFYYGPLAPYLNSLLYGVFGVRVEILALAGIASAGLMCWALWLLTRRFAGVVASTAVTLTFVYACAFPHLQRSSGIFNFALPYTFSATYGIVVATWSLLFLIAHVQTRRPGALAASVALLVVTAFSKLECLFPCACAHAAMWVAGGVPRRRVLAAYGIAVAAIAAGYALLALHIAPGLALGLASIYENVTALMNERSDPFIRLVMGFEDPAGSVGGLAIACGVLAFTFAIAGLLAWAQAWVRGTTARWVVVAVAAAAPVAAVLGWGTPDLLFATAPPLALAGSVLLAIRVLGRRSPPHELASRLVLWVFALACLARIILRPTLNGYGFYLLAPFLVPLAVLLCHDLPRQAPLSKWGRRTVASWGIGALLGTAATAAWTSRLHYAERQSLIATERGAMYVRETIAPEVISFLARLPPGARVVVTPQSSALNFFAARQGAGHMFSYLPMEFAHDEERELIERWTRSPPDVFVLTYMDLSYFGFGQFGGDYAVTCGEWIAKHYRVLPGPFTNSGILLAVRR
jgi:hypothetical protein